MNLYAVFQEGVYRHGCLGIFDRAEEAIQTAEIAALNDRDDWHNYDVVPFTLGKVGFGTIPWDGVPREQSVLYRARKGIDGIHNPVAAT